MLGCPLPSKSATLTALVFHRGPWYCPSSDWFAISSVGWNVLGDSDVAFDLARNRSGVRPQ
jgi:hypothetical protein